MTKQITPEEIPAIKVGALIAYIIVLIFAIWLLESTVCDIKEKGAKIAALFALFTVAPIVPSLYTIVIVGNFRQLSQLSLERKNKDKTVSDIVARLQSLVNQAPPNIDSIQDLLQQLQGQIYSIATSQQRVEARSNVVKQLKAWLNFLGKREILREATKRGLERFTRLDTLSPTDQEKVKKGFNKDLDQCLKWLITSLEVGVNQNTDGLKRSFIIQSSTRPYRVALEYIRDASIKKYCHNDLETEELRTYMDLLIEEF
ncbi:hypothetical protein [Limnofasciculus baicalensis]|uniref:Uncharacterized protein n=1 Tax=Limnofasciculus baicalensis BBK-W-15 TaxID=2699891 RepID=A0AAE3KP16_9CYAN|nr:hypothetical protein [Limnofasciculus baicalensis]MCP2730426.1 hypothetical protein [Limnofasciculus baicalensis BBK-W-15]